MATISKMNKIFVGVVGISMLLLSYLGSIGCNGEPPPASFNKNFRLIFPQTTNVPTINGLLTDAAWNDSFELGLEEGSTSSQAKVHGVADANNIYMHFEIEDNGFDITDVLFVAFNPSSTDSDYHLLVIYPCEFGESSCPNDGSSINPDVDYYTGTKSGSTVTWGSPGPAPAGVSASVATAGGTNWSVELKLPRGAPFNFPNSSYFGFYTSIAETDLAATNADDLVTEYTWPYNNETGDTNVISTITNLPQITVWGNASLSTSIGNGVRISSSDIYTNYGPSTIHPVDPNTFYAEAHNNTLQSGTLVTANSVRATFKWANFGLPSYSSFHLIPEDATPAAGNPTGYQSILATDTALYSINWQTQNQAERDFYSANRHWCVRVDLDSTDPSTVFYDSSAQANMDFVEIASPFKANATIATKGYVLPKDSRQHDFIVEEKFYNTDPKMKWQSQIEGMNKVNSRGIYKLSIAPEKNAKLGFAVLPPVVAIPYKEYQVKPGMDGGNNPYVQIPVRKGQIVTLISQGTVVVPPIGGTEPGTGPVVTGPLGRTVKSTTLTKPVLYKSRTDQVQLGALVGSWDNFKESSFMIGAAKSLKVPAGAKYLYLATNSIKGKEGEIAGTGYQTRAIVSDIKDYQLKTNPSLGLTNKYTDVVPLGSNLPTVIYRGKRKTGKTLTIKGKTLHVYDSVGSFGYIVKGKKK